MNICYIESGSTNAAYNLAFEQYVFDDMPKDRQYFMLWQNNNAIIIGKNQNTMEEINSAIVKEKNVDVVRRLSGGGAVYHDIGNLNFTFISDAQNVEKLNMKVFTEPIISTLCELGIEAKQTGRNDIVINGKKFSGNSQYIKNNRVMHHGTILFDSNLDMIQKMLNVSKQKIKSKGLKSIKSRMTNIKDHLDSDIELTTFIEILKKNVFKNAAVEDYILGPDDDNKIQQIMKERYGSWDWNYGFSPEYSIVREQNIEGCGHVKLYIDIKDGRIDKFSSSGDYFGSGDICDLEELLKDRRYEDSEIRRALKDVNIDYYYNKMAKDVFIRLMID